MDDVMGTGSAVMGQPKGYCWKCAKNGSAAKIFWVQKCFQQCFPLAVFSTNNPWCRSVIVVVLPKHHNKTLRLSLYTCKERWTKCSIHLSSISGTQRKLNRGREKRLGNKFAAHISLLSWPHPPPFFTTQPLSLGVLADCSLRIKGPSEQLTWPSQHIPCMIKSLKSGNLER